eukprot:COSAG03_NODE_11643_length_582_cov_719.910973_1_plen_51_part_01
MDEGLQGRAVRFLARGVGSWVPQRSLKHTHFLGWAVSVSLAVSVLSLCLPL